MNLVVCNNGDGSNPCLSKGDNDFIYLCYCKDWVFSIGTNITTSCIKIRPETTLTSSRYVSPPPAQLHENTAALPHSYPTRIQIFCVFVLCNFVNLNILLAPSTTPPTVLKLKLNKLTKKILCLVTHSSVFMNIKTLRIEDLLATVLKWRSLFQHFQSKIWFFSLKVEEVC